MNITELTTKNGKVFRVAVTNNSQRRRLSKVIEANKKKGYEVFTKIEDIVNGIHTISDFEKIAEKLV